MCKVMMIAGIKPEHVNKVQRLTKEMAKVISRIEDDGVGYAAITKTGKIYGEKWLNKENAFVLHEQPKLDNTQIFMNALFGDTVKWKVPFNSESVYTTFGEMTPSNIADTSAIILHARKATHGNKTIENVHPFVILNNEDHPDTALIHNGSIMNHDKLTKTMSTCDSEVILHEYLAEAMYYNPWAIEQVAETLAGEYTVGVLGSTDDADGNIIPYLDIFKSGKDLHAGYVPEIETVVFCTNEYSLEEAVKSAEMTIKNLVEIKDGYLIRLDAVSGQRIDDAISFTLSKKYAHVHTIYGGHHGHNGHHRPFANMPMAEVNDGITDSGDQTLEVIKKNFEKHHADLFTAPYFEIQNRLTKEENEFYTELDKNNKTDKQALRLVAAAMSVKG